MLVNVRIGVLSGELLKLKTVKFGISCYWGWFGVIYFYFGGRDIYYLNFNGSLFFLFFTQQLYLKIIKNHLGLRTKVPSKPGLCNYELFPHKSNKKPNNGSYLLFYVAL